MDIEPSDKAPSDPEANPVGEPESTGAAAVPTFNHPKALSGHIAHVEKRLLDGEDPSEAVAALCESALANPGSLIEPAANFLSQLLSDGRLPGCTSIPPAFLVEELTQESVAVTTVLFARWEEAGDAARITRLADGVADRGSRLQGRGVGSFILDLAKALAIQKPVRSLRLIELARALVKGGDKNPGVSEARRWQTAGDFLNGDGRTSRTFWSRLLKKSGKPTDWESDEAAKALKYLKQARDKGKKIPALLMDVVPPVAWGTVADSAQKEKPAAESKPAVEVEGTNEAAAEAPAETPAALRGSADKKKSGFLSGFLIGGVSMLLTAGWMWRDSILKQPEPQPAPTTAAPLKTVATTPPVPVVNPPPSPVPAPVEKPTAAPITPEVKAEPAIVVPAKPAVPFVAMVVPKDEPSPSAPEKPQRAPVTETKSERPEDSWRKAEFQALAKQHPALLRWHSQARTSQWREAGGLVMGLKTYLPFGGEEYPPFITMLLLDPPSDAEVAEAVPKLAARRMKITDILPLWERLVYPGSPNEKQIRAAADALLTVKKEVLGPSAVERLEKLVRPTAP